MTKPAAGLGTLAEDARLRTFADDYVMLRRCLVDDALLARDAGEYWRVGGPVDV